MRSKPASDPMDGDARTSSSLEWTLRVGAFMCFAGHGAFGLMTKAAWVPFFAVVGIGPDTAYRLMPLIGAVDILFGTLTLIRPRPALLAWMTLWAVWTAALRPLSGQPFWEAVERAGNYGVPFALLILFAAPHDWRSWFGAARKQALDAHAFRRLRLVLTTATAFLLIGHGALAGLGKPELVSHFALLGLPWPAEMVTRVIGYLEIGAAALLLWRQTMALCLFICLWKIATESLFLAAGAPVWELVERGGSYAAPLALALLLRLQQKARFASRTEGEKGMAGQSIIGWLSFEP